MKKYEKKLKEEYMNTPMDEPFEYTDGQGDWEEELVADPKSEYEVGYEDGYNAAKEEEMDGMYSESTKTLKEAKDDPEKAKDAIKGIIEKDWGGSNEDQYGAVQLLSGLASNDSKEANDFMNDLNKLTDKMDLSKYGVK